MPEKIERSASALIRRLGLRPHPEGGWFRETYRAAEIVPAPALPERFSGDRSFCTAIYFLLEKGDFSAFHRIRSDEIWHFHAGAGLLIHVLDPEGEYRVMKLGPGSGDGESYQAMVPAGCWFGAEIRSGGDFALVGCTVAPGFDFADLEMAARATLIRQFPGQEPLIRRMTRQPE